MTECGTQCYSLVDKVVISHRLELMILEVFSSLNGSAAQEGKSERGLNLLVEEITKHCPWQAAPRETAGTRPLLSLWHR